MTKDVKQRQSGVSGKRRQSMTENSLNEAVAKAIEFGSTYPNATTQQSGTTYGAPASNVQQLITQTLQGVLGRSFKPGDHESFKAALNVSFEVQQVSGKNVYKHIPRAYPAVGASDIGAGISGAQYSLVTFAKALHQQTQPLIKNLQSLNTSVDREDLGAITAIFTSAWDELIAELSREGGPRASRADALADSIFLKDSKTGLLVDLGNQLGVTTEGNGIVFDRAKVITTEEEGHLTNFIALVDYYVAVSEAWIRYRETFLRTDLGSGLLLIERALAVIEDGVNELYMAMDSVNIDQAERLILTVGFPEPPKRNLTVEDLLSWISYFASQEGPTLIRDGGRRGVQAIIPTAEKLDHFTGKFIEAINSPNSSALPQQFKHSRVINPLRELQLYMKELLKHANAVATLT